MICYVTPYRDGQKYGDKYLIKDKLYGKDM